MAALQGQSRSQVNAFVAGCAERMSQIFTGIRGEDRSRVEDVELFLRILDDLWDFDASQELFNEHLNLLDEFPEISSADEVVDVAEIYCFYSVLSLRYAVLSRAGGGVDSALECAHIGLTAMGQLDQNLAGAEYFVQEGEGQSREAGVSLRKGIEQGEIEGLRNLNREIGRERLMAILSRAR
ncbi:hypothetical protein [Amycolatopsis sp. w19]|uniref:hypothetical protein n=1 Tax=Amycolatopsis sp. w19 TaxID=3448134 RepID=UPI003F1B3559